MDVLFYFNFVKNLLFTSRICTRQMRRKEPLSFGCFQIHNFFICKKIGIFTEKKIKPKSIFSLKFSNFMLPIYWPDRGMLASRVTLHSVELISALKIVKQTEKTCKHNNFRFFHMSAATYF